MPVLPPIIAIDGPSASGKGTIARRLAQHFGFAHLDTGLLYRSTALLANERGHLNDEVKLIVFAQTELTPELVLAKFNAPFLRSDEVGIWASKVAAMPAIRTALLKFQQDFCGNPPGGKGAVLDGRDIGTAIAPQAPVKIYVTASVETRAQRRLKELQAAGGHATYAAVLADMKERDARDANRAAAPAKPAPDAVMLDTSSMTAEEAFRQALAMAEERLRA